ncbi:MAG TPA: transglutaminase domain-containing protein [Bacteroidia bacterium]|jgi:hypothetical protein|nr:transglutaminase domain-containing protein [Bacteroidia bacterium]
MNEQELIAGLKKISTSISLFLATIQMPYGCCFVFGHALAEGLSQAGFETREVSGTLILADKNDRKIIYGSKKYKGKNVGDFHTWCEIMFEGKVIIVDPSLFFNQLYLKREENIKLNQKIPEIYIGSVKDSWHLTYIEDPTLVCHSKDCLKGTVPWLVEHLIKSVNETGKLMKYGK